MQYLFPYAAVNEFERKPDLCDNIGDYGYEIYVVVNEPQAFTVYVQVGGSNIDLTLQAAVTCTDDDYDLHSDYGTMVTNKGYAQVIGAYVYRPNKTLRYIDFECHIYENDIYQDAFIFAFPYSFDFEQ